MPSTISDSVQATGGFDVGNATNPPRISGGAGAMDTVNRSNASLHLRTDADTLPEVLHNGSTEKLGLAQHAIECRLADLTANGTTTYTTFAPRDVKVTGISRRYTVKPSSSAGTVVASVQGNAKELLASASEDEEGLSNDVLTSHALTGTAADLIFSKGDKIVVSIVSNNADMTGGTDPMYYIYFEDN